MPDYSFPIIFVHLGNQEAPHLAWSIEQARRAAPNTAIFAILSENTTMAFDAKNAGAIPYCAESLPMTEDHHRFVSSIRRRLGKKKGFWRFATERFFYIEELMREMGAKRALHIESDNLIYFDPMSIADRLAALYPGLAAPFVNDTSCAPGVVFISSLDAIHRLNAYIARRIMAAADDQNRWYWPRLFSRVRLGPVLHDMNLLADYRKEFGDAALCGLPNVPPDYRRETSISHQYSYSYGFEQLGMIFDAAAIGPYYYGLNPKEHTAAGGAAHVEAGSYAHGGDFDFSHLDPGSIAPVIMWRDKAFRIGSIHNASKQSVEELRRRSKRLTSL